MTQASAPPLPAHPRPTPRPAAAPWPEPWPACPPRSANLSDSYFTNRQDRYVFLQDCPEVADFFAELVEAVGDVSLQLQADDTVQVVEGMVHPYKGRARLGRPLTLGLGGWKGGGEHTSGGRAAGWESGVAAPGPACVAGTRQMTHWPWLCSVGEGASWEGGASGEAAVWRLPSPGPAPRSASQRPYGPLTA